VHSTALLRRVLIHLPGPIEDVIKVPVSQVRQLRVDNKGLSIDGSAANFNSMLRKSSDQPVSNEAGLMMLTGDENLVDVSFIVQWQIANASDFLFRLQTPEATIGAVAESAMREVIGQSAEKDILSGGRGQIESSAKVIMQKILDEYHAGVSIISLQMQLVQPPSEVLDKFRDVQTAKSDKETAVSQAIAYKNKVVNEAKGKVAQIKAEANAYSKKVSENASGEAARFDKVYNEYVKAKEVTRSRLYLETMEDILKPMNKIIIDSKSGAMPYIALDQLKTRPVMQQSQPQYESSNKENLSSQFTQGTR
jgi:modulator of FtsH protease HflK